MSDIQIDQKTSQEAAGWLARLVSDAAASWEDKPIFVAVSAEAFAAANLASPDKPHESTMFGPFSSRKDTEWWISRPGPRSKKEAIAIEVAPHDARLFEKAGQRVSVRWYCHTGIAHIIGSQKE
jgi:hypothetical protein